MKKFIGEKSGAGVLEHDSGERWPVRYRIHDYVERIPAGTKDDPQVMIDGMRGTEGRIKFNDWFLDVGNYVLHLASGERL